MNSNIYLNKQNKSNNLTKYYNTFLCYYSILLNSSKLSLNQFINTKSSYDDLFKYRQLILNLSSNFLDSSFINLLKENISVIKRLFNFILFSLYIFESNFNNSYYYTHVKQSKVKKRKEVNVHEKYTSNENQEVEHKKFLLSIILVDSCLIDVEFTSVSSSFCSVDSFLLLIVFFSI